MTTRFIGHCNLDSAWHWRYYLAGLLRYDLVRCLLWYSDSGNSKLELATSWSWAFIETTLIVNERFERMNNWASIMLDTQIKLAGNNPTGEVHGGSITLFYYSSSAEIRIAAVTGRSSEQNVTYSFDDLLLHFNESQPLFSDVPLTGVAGSSTRQNRPEILFPCREKSALPSLLLCGVLCSLSHLRDTFCS